MAAACGQAGNISTRPTPTPARPSDFVLAESLNITWQWRMEEHPVDLSLDVDWYDIDLFENHASVVAALHSLQRKVICYVSAGSWEPTSSG